MAKQLTIRFVRPWEGRPIGRVERLLGYGQALTLIEHGFAVRHEEGDASGTDKPRRRRNREAGEE